MKNDLGWYWVSFSVDPVQLFHEKVEKRKKLRNPNLDYEMNQGCFEQVYSDIVKVISYEIRTKYDKPSSNLRAPTSSGNQVDGSPLVKSTELLLS